MIQPNMLQKKKSIFKTNKKYPVTNSKSTQTTPDLHKIKSSGVFSNNDSHKQGNNKRIEKK